MGGALARMGERRSVYRVLVVKPEEKRLLGRPRRRGIILKRTFRAWDGGHGLDYLAQNRDRWRALVNAVMNLRIQDTDLSSPICI